MKKKSSSQATTIQQLSKKIDGGFRAVDRRFDHFAGMVQKEFLASRQEMNDRFDQLEVEVKAIRRDFEDLKLRSQQYAYHFEIRDLEKRLQKVETKLKLGA